MAAGQGFKTFTTGEVLSAADVNGYLMQGVLVFANSAERDSEITSPQEGQFAYLKDTNVTTYYTGSAWANLDTTGMTNPMTTTGDTIYSSSGSTPARLGIGSTGQVLTVSGGVPTWTTPGGATLNTSLITSGTVTSGTSLTLSSLTSYDELFLVMSGLTTGTAGSQLDMRINGVTTGVYDLLAIENRLGGTNAGTGQVSAGNSRFLFGANYGWKNTNQNGILFSLTNCKSASGFTNVAVNGTWEHFNTSDRIIYTANHVFASNATVSSISLFWEDGYSFTGGTYRLYGA